MRALLRQVEEIRHAHGGRRVVEVQVSIGEFSGVEPDLLVSAFEQLALSTHAQNASLAIQQVPLEARCGECGREWRVERFRFECVACGSRLVEVVRGEDLMLESVSLAEDDP